MKWILISLLLLCAIAVEARPRWRRQCATQCQMQRLTPLQARVLWIKKSDGAFVYRVNEIWPNGVTCYDVPGAVLVAGPEQYVPAGDPPTAEGVEAPKPNEQLPTPAQPVTDSGEELPPAPPTPPVVTFCKCGDTCPCCDEALKKLDARTAEVCKLADENKQLMTQLRGVQDQNASLIECNNGLTSELEKCQASGESLPQANRKASIFMWGFFIAIGVLVCFIVGYSNKRRSPYWCSLLLLLLPSTANAQWFGQQQQCTGPECGQQPQYMMQKQIVGVARTEMVRHVGLKPNPDRASGWHNAPPLHTVDVGRLLPVLADLECRMPQGYKNPHTSDVLTWAHETTHKINNKIYNEEGLEALYCLGGNVGLFHDPHVTRQQVAALIPTDLRGDTTGQLSIWNLYMTAEAEKKNIGPPSALYILDEWTSFMNGQEAALEWRKNGRSWGPSDLDQDVIFMIQFTGFAAKLLEAIDKYDPDYVDKEKLRDFISWNTERALRIAREAKVEAPVKVFAARLVKGGYSVAQNPNGGYLVWAPTGRVWQRLGTRARGLSNLLFPGIPTAPVRTHVPIPATPIGQLANASSTASQNAPPASSNITSSIPASSQVGTSTVTTPPLTPVLSPNTSVAMQPGPINPTITPGTQVSPDDLMASLPGSQNNASVPSPGPQQSATAPPVVAPAVSGVSSPPPVVRPSVAPAQTVTPAGATPAANAAASTATGVLTTIGQTMGLAAGPAGWLAAAGVGIGGYLYRRSWKNALASANGLTINAIPQPATPEQVNTYVPVTQTDNSWEQAHAKLVQSFPGMQNAVAQITAVRNQILAGRSKAAA